MPINKAEDFMTLDGEYQKNQAFDMYVKALASAPDSLVKSMTGKEYAIHAVEGAKVIEEYLYPKLKK
jgi:hypothetical protein